MPENTSQWAHSLQSEHRQIRLLLGQLSIIDRGLTDGEYPGAVRLLEQVRHDLVRQVRRHLRQEEIQVYPALVCALGSEVPVKALLADHHRIRNLIDDLGQLLDDRHEARSWPERAPVVRGLVHQLARILELHLRREDAAFGSVSQPSPLLCEGGP